MFTSHILHKILNSFKSKPIYLTTQFLIILFLIYSNYLIQFINSTDDLFDLPDNFDRDVRYGMEEEDGDDTRAYINKKEEKLNDFLRPYKYKRVCYFANWAAKRRSEISRVVPEDVDPTLCTHINFAFAKVGEDLNVKPYEEDDTAGWTGGPGMYQRITALRGNNSDLKIMLSIGGWTHASKGFNEVVRDDASIDKFVANAIAYLRKYDFDGFDLDWEYPGATDRQAENKTKRGFTKLVRKLREEFEREAYEKDKPRFLLSAAVGAAKQRIDDGYEIDEICKDFDFINVMTYDYHGSWDGVTGHNSPLYPRKDEKEPDKFWNINSSMHIWIERGCPKDKLNVGISAYARSFSMFSEKPSKEIGTKASAAEAGQYTMEPGVLAYYEVCEVMNKDKSIQVFWHEEHDVPYAYKPGLWIGFDNLESVINKAKYVKNMQLGGVIVWSLDMDDKTGKVCNQGPYPVLNTLKNELTKPEPPTTTSDSLVSSYPRGFWSKRHSGYRSKSIRIASFIKVNYFIIIYFYFIYLIYFLI